MKQFTILIWGIGDWARKLLNLLPYNCKIEAFVQSSITQQNYRGIPVIDGNSFLKRYYETDFTIIAVNKSEEIIDYCVHNLDDCKSLFDLREKKGRFYAVGVDVSSRHELNDLFCEAYMDQYKNAYASAYSVCKCDNLNFLVNTRYKRMINHLLTGKCYQQDDMDRFIELCHIYKPSMNPFGFLLDIGANIGTSAIYLKKKLPNIKIIGFEPEPENCRQFKVNCILNDIPDDEFKIECMALSNKNGNARLMISDDNNMGDNRISINGNNDSNRQTLIVPVKRLDDYLADNDISEDEISCIWMDVQAHEAFVLEGAISVLAKSYIPLLIEFWPIELKRNMSLRKLVSNLSQIYSHFIPIKSYHQLEAIEYPISDMIDIANQSTDSDSYDFFLINKESP